MVCPQRSIALLALLVSTVVGADWVKVDSTGDMAANKFIDTKAIRQTGPMNTMRRVWELSNLAKRTSNQMLSIKSQVEYDCKDHRMRTIAVTGFSEHWAEGEPVPAAGSDAKPGEWSDITSGSLGESIFKRVCPSDDS
jgi:hypothetical protein